MTTPSSASQSLVTSSKLFIAVPLLTWRRAPTRLGSSKQGCAILSTTRHSLTHDDRASRKAEGRATGSARTPQT
jgi:hypothetical protein